jgi:hypothetical protein
MVRTDCHHIGEEMRKPDHTIATVAVEGQFERAKGSTSKRNAAEELLAINGLGEGQSLVWEKCPNEHKTAMQLCSFRKRLGAHARHQGIKYETWHTKDGGLVLSRLIS